MTFRIPKIKSCCCFSLETGSKIIGCIHLMFFVAGLTLPILYVRPVAWGVHIIRGMVYESIFLNMGIFAFIMLYGAFQRDHQLVFPWVMLQSILLIFFLCSLIGHMLYLGLMDTRNRYMEFEFFMSMYFFFTMLVVYNFYRDLKEERRSDEQI